MFIFQFCCSSKHSQLLRWISEFLEMWPCVFGKVGSAVQRIVLPSSSRPKNQKRLLILLSRFRTFDYVVTSLNILNSLLVALFCCWRFLCEVYCMNICFLGSLPFMWPLRCTLVSAANEHRRLWDTEYSKQRAYNCPYLLPQQDGKVWPWTGSCRETFVAARA